MHVTVLRITSSNNKHNNNSNNASQRSSEAGPFLLVNETGNVEILLDLAFAKANTSAQACGANQNDNSDESRQCGYAEIRP